MTQQEMETIVQELETTFKQPVNEKPWKTDGLAFGRYINESANYETKTFVTYFGVALWFNNVVVSTITSVAQWEAFKSVARLFSQQEIAYDEKWEEDSKDSAKRWEMSQGTYKQIGTHTGQCIECERVSIVSDASGLCEACTLEAQTGCTADCVRTDVHSH